MFLTKVKRMVPSKRSWGCNHSGSATDLKVGVLIFISQGLDPSSNLKMNLYMLLERALRALASSSGVAACPGGRGEGSIPGVGG